MDDIVVYSNLCEIYLLFIYLFVCEDRDVLGK